MSSKNMKLALCALMIFSQFFIYRCFALTFAFQVLAIAVPGAQAASQCYNNHCAGCSGSSNCNKCACDNCGESCSIPEPSMLILFATALVIFVVFEFYKKKKNDKTRL